MRTWTSGADARALAALATYEFTIIPRITGIYNGVDLGTFDIADGTYTSDETTEVRDRCDITFPVPDVKDPSVFDPSVLDVIGHRFRVELGVALNNLTTYVTLGTFVVYNRTEAESASGRTITLEGYDVTVLVRDADFEQLYLIGATTPYNTAITGVINQIGLDVVIPTTTFSTPLLTFEEGTKRLESVRNMALSCGWEVLATPDGKVWVRPLKGVASSVWDFVEGDTCRMTDIGRTRTRQGVYNIARVSGEASGAAAVSAIAYDNDPKSPTYVTDVTQGTFGRVPIFEKSQFVTTLAQAQAAANALILAKKGIAAAIGITGFTNPALEVGDTVHVVRSRFGIDKTVPLKSLSIPLNPNKLMTVTTREAA
jgi:hypothetical protein